MPITRAAERRNSLNTEKTGNNLNAIKDKVSTCKSPTVDSVYNDTSLDSVDSSLHSMDKKDDSDTNITSFSEPLNNEDDSKKEFIEISEEDGEDSSISSTPGPNYLDHRQSHELLGSTPLVSNSFSSTIIKTSQSSAIDPNGWIPNQRNLFLSDMHCLFLEKIYQMTPYLDSDLKRKLSVKLNIHPEKVKMWFQNRRTKDRQYYRKQGKEPHWLTKTSRTKQIQSSMKSIISDLNFDFENFNYAPMSSFYDTSNMSSHSSMNSFNSQLSTNPTVVNDQSGETLPPPPPPSTQHFVKSQENLSNLVLVSSLQDLTNLLNNQNPNCISQVFQNGELSGILPNIASESNSYNPPTNALHWNNSAALSNEKLNGYQQSDLVNKNAQMFFGSVDKQESQMNGNATPYTCNSQSPEKNSRASSKENADNSNNHANSLYFQNMSHLPGGQPKVNCNFFGSPFSAYQYPGYVYQHQNSSYPYPSNLLNYGGYYAYPDHSATVMQPYVHSGSTMPRMDYANCYLPQCKNFSYNSQPSYYHSQNCYYPGYHYNSMEMQSTLPRIESFLSPHYESQQSCETDYATSQQVAESTKSPMTIDWADSLSVNPNSGIADVSCDNDFSIDQIIGPLSLDANLSTKSAIPRISDTAATYCQSTDESGNEEIKTL